MRGHHHDPRQRNTRRPDLSAGEEASFIYCVTGERTPPKPNIPVLTEKQRRFWKTLVDAGWDINSALLRARGLL